MKGYHGGKCLNLPGKFWNGFSVWHELLVTLVMIIIIVDKSEINVNNLDQVHQIIPSEVTCFSHDGRCQKQAMKILSGEFSVIGRSL